MEGPSPSRSRTASKNRASVTGDYRRGSAPRLVLVFVNGEITIWSASLKFIEDTCARDIYDFSGDVLSPAWAPDAALAKMRQFPRAEIANVLLDQAIFAGVGNIIKNEVLFRTRTSPFARVGRLSDARLKAIVSDARTFAFRFLELRRRFALRKHLKAYNRSACPACARPITRRIHGERRQRTFFCASSQRVRRMPADASNPGRSAGKDTTPR